MKFYQWTTFVLSLHQILIPVSGYDGVADTIITATVSANLLTTATSTWSTSSTSIEYQPFGPWSRIDYITTQYIRQTSSRGTFLSYPTTVIDHGTTTVDYFERVLPTTGPGQSSSWTSTYLSSTTYFVYQPQPTDMAAGITLNNVPCGPCAPAGWKADPTCVALGLDTACQGQCLLEDGFWWCRHLTGLEIVSAPQYQMGRVCWGNGSAYHQLMTPCIQGDHMFECLACTNSNTSFNINSSTFVLLSNYSIFMKYYIDQLMSFF
ncbi:uncharacterized protein LY89DRAFT_735191 [Mollisia scopiformis]|uniref:Uncharacterized protein n=1 Tax=Mollisia scopiformis TaxID=149040 RepID=A0A194X7H7_MOLSC|nr:uncharacterized protein LY89DRAFT_735191 [Mollisia scopiformis]KUJ16049.1 hypothetical protein LY89DRAFT_735191 [Mollisia scopiformis]